MAKVGRNAPCPCGSGKKHKKCCLSKTPGPPVSPKKRPEATHTHGVPTDILKTLGLLLNEQGDRRLQEHREEAFLRSEFKRMGRTDEEIDKMFPERGRTR